MEYADFINHIESLEEYKELRKRKNQFKEISITPVVPLKVTVEITWGLNEPTPDDIDVYSYVHDHARRVYLDPVVKAKIAEQKNAAKEYLKDMKSLVKREAKKFGVRVQRNVGFHSSETGVFDIEDILYGIA